MTTQHAQHLFEDVAFPGTAIDRMAEQIVGGLQPQEGVEQAGIAQEDFRGLDQPAS